MSHPPTGTLTFLFTDIKGSTARWETQREAMAAALVRHDALLRAAIEGRGGTVFKTVGDAFCAVFADAEEALGAAMDAQRALAAEAWSAFGPEFADLRVRMGIHHGKAEERGGDYFGPSLNRTARLMSAGHGGQVLLSLAAQQVVRDYLSTAATKAGTAPDPSTLRRDCIPPPTGHPRSRRQAVPVG
ncbi:MAG: adenylate/guanylate cyclase domain-containing protein [Ardenticatenia bacterium]|nr:adenylate/guanylate cyclase domain-containing protein [Ardenticatenia bacterium]